MKAGSHLFSENNDDLFDDLLRIRIARNSTSMSRSRTYVCLLSRVGLENRKIPAGGVTIFNT